jgi:hypothetical protein
VRIDKKIQRLKDIDLHQIINDAARDKKDQILKLNQDQMYDQGVMDITKPQKKLKYAPGTIQQKKKKATFKRTNHITLRWFGDFYDKMKIIFFRKEFVITSTDLKWANWLEPQERFSKALGLTDKSMKKLRTILRPQIIKRTKQQI